MIDGQIHYADMLDPGRLEQFRGMRIDITPGIELYYNLSRQHREEKSFFEQYQDRILYGTDIGARQVVRSRGEKRKALKDV